MKFQSETREDITVLTLVGNCKQADPKELAAVFSELKGHGGKRLVLDLSATDALPSRILGQVLAATYTIEEKGGRIAVVTDSESIRVALVRLGMDKLVSVFDNLEDALSALKAEAASGDVTQDTNDQT